MFFMICFILNLIIYSLIFDFIFLKFINCILYVFFFDIEKLIINIYII